MAPKRSSRIYLLSLRVVAVFVLFCLIWVPTTDALVESWADNTRELTRLQSLKATLFLTLVAILLYALIVQALRSQRRAEEHLATEHVRLKLVMEQIPAHLWTTDRDLRITSFLGRDSGSPRLKVHDPIGTTLYESLGTDDPTFPSIAGHREALQGKGVTYSVEWDDRWYRTILAPLRNDAGEVEGCVGLSVDVTEDRQKDEQLRETITKLQAANEVRDRLVTHLVHAEQMERERISSGIHDDSIQVMTSAAMALDLLLERVQDQHAVEILKRTRTSVGESIKRLRRLAFELKPVELDNDGLGPAIRLALERASVEAGFRFELDDRLKVNISATTRYLLYRVASEAITNVRKHAGARNVSVSLEQVDGGIELQVRDDGTGLHPSVTEEPHFGLNDMQKRADAVGGRFRCSTLLEGGTCVEFWVPLSDDAVAGIGTETQRRITAEAIRHPSR